MSDDQDVLAANDRLYEVFAKLDLAEMEKLWLRSDRDVCIHPGWEVLVGWAAVRESWRVIFANTDFIRLASSDEIVRRDGRWASVVCIENIFSVVDSRTVHSRVACTNLFQREDDGWRLWMHHGSPLTVSEQAAQGDET